MIFKRVGEDEDVIEVDHYEDVSHVSEDVIHEGLECRGSIGQTHGHNQELKGSILGVKGCLPLMASGDVNIVVASMQVEEVGDKWDQVPILPCELVEVPKVD